MKRYGDNVSNEDLLAQGAGDGQGQVIGMLRGGCGATYGTFPKPVRTPVASKAPQKSVFARLAGLFSLQGRDNGEK